MARPRRSCAGRTLRSRGGLASVLLLAWLVVSPSTGAARHTQTGDGVARLLQGFEQAVASGDPRTYLGLLAAGADTSAARAFADSLILPGATRVVVRERDRSVLPGSPAGSLYRVIADVFSEFGSRARLATCQLRLRQDAAGSQWAIEAQEMISSFGSLCRLALGRKEYVATDVVLSADDLELRMASGSIFTAEIDSGVTGLVLVGKGHMLFRPAPPTEREQMKIFAGRDDLDASFSAAFVRVPPDALRSIVKGTIDERPVDPSTLRKAEEIFRTDSPKSFGVNLPDLSSDMWSILPSSTHFLAEVHTGHYGILTYTRSPHESEDISLFQRESRRNICLYMSRSRLAERGPFYSEDDESDYEAVHYDIEASLDPLRESIEGTALLTLRVRADSLSMLTLRLAQSLTVDSVTGRDLGRLMCLRIRNQNTLVLYLPKTVTKATVLGLTVKYHGRVTAQPIDREAVAVQSDGQQELETRDAAGLLEPSYLYSNRSYWYPQAEAGSFATATLRLKVPSGYACLASGDPTPATADAMARNFPGGTELVFRAVQPARYLSVLVARLVPLVATAVDARLSDAVTADGVPGNSGVFYHHMDVRSFASASLRSRADVRTERATDILRFYASLLGDFPYPSLTLALVERELPGGHSPAYLAVLSEPSAFTTLNWRADPTSFVDFPEFFLAHELAHQWWGQAIGWKNYHEQWLSEGLAQYFAALYAERLHGKDVFDGIIRRMQTWAVKKSAQGPVYLGYRIGHIKRDPQDNRAIVYNKSAAVLHMLRRLLGDDVFFRGLRRFYFEWRFRKAGTDDLRKAFEQESGRSLERFFDRWIYDWRLPRLKASWRVERRSAGGPDEAVVRIEQVGDVFDVPVTVTLEYSDKPLEDHVVCATDAVTEVHLPIAGKLRRVTFNRDQAAVAYIVK